MPTLEEVQERFRRTMSVAEEMIELAPPELQDITPAVADLEQTVMICREAGMSDIQAGIYLLCDAYMQIVNHEDVGELVAIREIRQPGITMVAMTATFMYALNDLVRPVADAELPTLD